MVQLSETPLVTEIVYERLKNQILPLRTGVNVRIPSERALSEQLGVSRLSIRTALKRLSEEGLLMQHQGKGTYITPFERINSICLICSPDIKSTDPFYSKFLTEIANETAKRSINLIMVDSRNLISVQSGTPVIITGLLEKSVLDSISSIYDPVIAVQEYPWLSDITQISFDDYKIGFDAAKILFGHNHKCILHLAGPEKFPSAFYRKKGLYDAADQLGIHVETVTDKMNWSGGFDQGSIFIKKQSQKERPTAVFAANDWMAAGFMKRLQEYGFRIPEDVSVLGCDNIPLSVEYAPALSTFDLDMKLLVRELFITIENIKTASLPASPTVPSKRILLPATPVLRESIRKL